MPARVSSSVHGLWRGDFGIRFCIWHALVAEPLLTYMAPCASITNGCIGWSPVNGRPERITVGASVGTLPVVGNAYRTMRSLTSANTAPR